ncbi:MAG: winged helix-turn-helix domain-containing protein [Woeseiaceae bacterium]
MTYEIDDLTVDVERGTVHRGDERLSVRGLSFELLRVLIEKAPEPVSIDELSSTVWRDQVVGDDTIAQRIKLLRSALGDNATEQRYVTTVRNAGYRLTSLPNQPHENTSGRQRFMIAATAAIIAALALASLKLVKTDSTDTAADNTEFRLGSAVDRQLERARELIKIRQAAATDRAIDLLNEALATEPGHIGARTALSFAYSQRVTKFSGNADDAGHAESLARSLITEQPDGARGWHALGYALDSQGQIDEALSAYKQAFLLDPSDAAAMSSAAYLLQVRGQLYESLMLEVKAMRTAPPTLYGPVQIASTLSLLDDESAELWWQRAIATGPSQPVILAERLRQYLRHGEPVLALELFEQMPADVKALKRHQRLAGHAALQLGKHNEAMQYFTSAGQRAALDRLALQAMSADDALDTTPLIEARNAILAGDNWPQLRVLVAEVHAGLGDMDESFELLGEAIDMGWRDLKSLQQSPFLTPLRATPAWRQLEMRLQRLIDAEISLVSATDEIRQMSEDLAKTLQ